MKFLLSAVFAVAVAASGTEVADAEYHLNSMQKLMPPSVEMLQVQALMLSKSTIDARDEIAALLFKMQRDINTENKNEYNNDRATQQNCAKQATKNNGIMSAMTARRIKAEKEIASQHAQQAAIPGQVIKIEASIKKIKSDILKAEVDIKKAQVARDAESAQFLQNLADFDKALGDIDVLRKIVENGLGNRGQGADKNQVAFTQSPTVKKAAVAPTPISNDRKVTHTATNAGKFLEVSTSEYASMSDEEVRSAMKGVYADLRAGVSHNHAVTSLVETLDAVMSMEMNAVDKIRSLLIQVRNELQKSKRELSQAENNAVNAWKTRKTNMRDAINNDKINWQNKYQTKASKWQTYGNIFQSEGQAMETKAKSVAAYDIASINLAFETTICKTAHADYKQNADKRNGQLLQIKKALELLAKMNLSGKYGEEVKKALTGVTAGLCRKFDDNSKWLKVDGSVTMSRRRTMNRLSAKKTCFDKVKVTYQSKAPIFFLQGGGAFTGLRVVDRGATKGEVSKTFDITAKWLEGPLIMSWLPRGGAAKVASVEYYSVPDCNCNSKFDADYKVSGDELSKLRAEGVSFLEAEGAK